MKNITKTTEMELELGNQANQIFNMNNWLALFKAKNENHLKKEVSYEEIHKNLFETMERLINNRKKMIELTELNILPNYPQRLLKDFCIDWGYDFLDEYNGNVIACTYEVIETVTVELVQPVIRNHWGRIKFHEHLMDWFSWYCTRDDDEK